ncbi:MAG TPA: hypothetical protein VGR22_04320, partial [Thermomicrobiales bacterium]|nr:hypothetical protein [Thermomicrobiales bacterium]
LTDVVMRRTMVGYARGAGLDAAPAIAQVAVESGYWSEREATEQVDEFRRYLARFLPHNMN